MNVELAPFGDRRNFAFVLQERHVWHAVEVGTDRGGFARDLLSSPLWNGNLWCIDPYLPCSQMNWDREADFRMACQILAPFVPRVRIIRSTSEDWIPNAAEFTPHIGFVYLDGDHSEAGVRKDIDLWWSILKPGGILAGHDLDAFYPGVEAAVRNFAEASDLTVYRVKDFAADSWYVEKKA